MIRKKGGIILITVYLVIIVLLILGGVFVTRAIWENRGAQTAKDFKQVFYIADAGLNKALYELKKDYFNWSGWTGVPYQIGRGEYQLSVTAVGEKRKVIVDASMPTIAAPAMTRQFELFVKRDIPPDFYGNAIYVSGKVVFKGSQYSVEGDVKYDYETPPTNTGGVTGDITQDDSISPLAVLDYQQLYDIANSQGNVYTEERLHDVQTGNDSFPSSFWYAPGTPNVVYVTTDLQLNGNIGTIGGFFVVVGDVLTDPASESETEINGNGQIEGCIYTLGEFKINGGGGNLNVNGGVWSGEQVRLNGTAQITYNSEYMNAIGDLNINPVVQAISWREIK